jgi:two-component system, NarL family, sensor histidine kinase UhpB
MELSVRLAAFWPTIFLAVLVAFVSYATKRLATPAFSPVTNVQASPAELPASWLVWQEPKTPEWRDVQLPIVLCKIRCETPYTAWRYRFDWRADQLADPAVYFSGTDANLALYLNGQLIDMRGRMESPPSVYRDLPRLVRLPRALLRASSNELAWFLTLERAGIGGQRPFHLGDYEQLRSAFVWRQAVVHDLILGGLWMQIGVWAVALGMLMRGNREPMLRWFLLAAVGWMVIAAMQVFPGIVHSVEGRSILFFAAFFLLIAFTPLFVTSLLEPPKSWLVRTAIAYFITGIVLTLIGNLWAWNSDSLVYDIANQFLKHTALLIIPFILWRLLRYLLANRDSPMAAWIFAASVITAIFGIHDATQSKALGPPIRLVPVAGLGIAIAFCLELGRRVLLSQSRLERYSVELESTVQAREAVLNEQYEKLRQADQERMLSEERSRIMRDMHDGVGGQLAVLVHMADDASVTRDEIVKLVRTGLSDMRMVLDSLNHAGGDLLIALGTFRERISPLVDANGVKLRWQMDPEIASQPFGPEVLLNVFRILQESINNALRHARAGQITVLVQAQASWLRISVTDDGVGFRQNELPTGHYGLSGMQHRAAKISATLTVESQPMLGTTVCLSLPIAAMGISG